MFYFWVSRYQTMEYPKMYLYQRIVNAKAYIDKHYADELQLEDISSEACFSKFHFVRLFKDIYGKSPNQYLQFVRMQAARKFLEGQLEVKEVCHKVGYHSVPTFVSGFKKEFGISPKKYAQQFALIEKKKQMVPAQFIPTCFSSRFYNYI